MADFIKFLGTAGARFVVTQQLRASGGMWLSLQETNLHVDPGPGALVKALKSRPKLDPATLEAVVLSHRHIDHSNDVNILLEAMTRGGFDPKGLLLAPRECYETDPVIRTYVLDYVARHEVLSAGSEHRAGNVTIRASRLPHHHNTAETYGLIFETDDLRLGYVADTHYFDELPSLYAGCSVLVINCVRLSDDRPDLDHLNCKDAARLLQEIRPKAGIITHFGLTMIKAKPWEEAKKLSDQVGLPVIAASDGLTFSLAGFAGGSANGCPA